MQDILRNNPFIRIVIPYIAGVIAGLYYIWQPDFFGIYITLSVLLFWMVCAATPLRKYQGLQSFMLLLFFLILGIYRAGDVQTKPQTYADKAVFLTRVIDYPDTTAKSVKIDVALKQHITDSCTQAADGKAFVYLPKDSLSRTIAAGDMLLIYARPALITNQNNPGAFDFKDWAASKGYFYQFYVPEAQWKYSKTAPPFSLLIYLKKLRRQIFEYYSKAGISDDELAVFSALTLGDKSMLSHDLRQGYVSAGLMHVLAVSGLHVGIIYLVISYLLKPVTKIRGGKFLRFIIALIVLWGYAMFTGLSPSVSRAATMFSVFALGDLFGRRYTVYNSIALAAFILLFYNPLLIKSVGFQMSFLAVIGIVGFYPVIYKWLYVPWKLVDKIWQLIAVSIAAQIITTPLSLYYFNQFPLLFLLSNLLMVPLATGLMYLFVMLLVLMPFPVVAYKIGYITNLGVNLMNNFTQWIEQLEWSTVQSVFVSDLQLLFLYMLIVVTALWGFKTNYRNLKYVYIIIALLLLSGVWQQYRKTTQNAFIVFHTFDKPLMMQIAGKACTVINPEGMEDTQWFTKPLFIENGLENYTDYTGYRKDSLKICFFGHNERTGIYYNIDHYPDGDPVQCRWLVLSENSPFDLERLLKIITPKQIIADASVSSFKLKKWKKYLQNTNPDTKIHHVKSDGAYIERW